MVRSTSIRFHVDCRDANDLHHLRHVERRHLQRVLSRRIGDRRGERGGVDAEAGGFALPACPQIRHAEPGLLRSGVDRGFAFHRRVLEPRRITTLTIEEVGELVTHLHIDLTGPLRELIEQLRRHAADLGLAVHDRIEHHPEPGRHLGAQHRLIEVAEGLLILLQRQRIQRIPATIRGLDLRRDHHMGMQLRIIRTARRLTKHPHRQPTRLRMQSGAVRADPCRRAVLLHHRHDRVDGDVVTLGEPLVTRQCPQHRQRLRC